MDSRSASYSAARGTKRPRSREVPSAPRVFRRVAACVKSSKGPCRSARRKLPKMEGTHVHRFPKGGEEIDTDVVRRKEFEKMRMKVANEKFGKREDAKELMTRMMQACIAAFAKDPLEFMIEFLTKEIEGRAEPVPTGPGKHPKGEEADLDEEVTNYAHSMEFHTIVSKMSAYMIQFKPDDPAPFCLEFLRTLKREGIFGPMGAYH